MNILYVILPVALLLSAGSIAAFIWTVSQGQLDDVDSPPRRILFEGDAPLRTLAVATSPAAPVPPQTGSGPVRS
jgi:cbb3-type cytochrome oxidase maturation protein